MEEHRPKNNHTHTHTHTHTHVEHTQTHRHTEHKDTKTHRHTDTHTCVRTHARPRTRVTPHSLLYASLCVTLAAKTTPAVVINRTERCNVRERLAQRATPACSPQTCLARTRTMHQILCLSLDGSFLDRAAVCAGFVSRPSSDALQVERLHLSQSILR